jgi:hypothetical protein
MTSMSVSEAFQEREGFAGVTVQAFSNLHGFAMEKAWE